MAILVMEVQQWQNLKQELENVKRKFGALQRYKATHWDVQEIEIMNEKLSALVEETFSKINGDLDARNLLVSGLYDETSVMQKLSDFTDIEQFEFCLDDYLYKLDQQINSLE